MFFYNFFWRFFFILAFLFGLLVILDSKQSLSYFRLLVFGIVPITISIIAIILRKNKLFIIVSSNVLILLFVLTSILEINFIKKASNNYTLKKNNKSSPQLCGASYLNVQNLSIYPLGGISKKNMIFQNVNDGTTDNMQSDRYGFNNSDSLWDLDDIHTVFLGDSFTYGSDVKSTENFPRLYKKKFDNTINLGCEGSGPIIQLAIFKEYVKKLNLKPKFIFWNYYSGNDITKNISNENQSFYKIYLKKGFSQNLPINQHKINKIINNFEGIEKTSDKNNYKKDYVNIYLNFYKFIYLRSKLGFTHAFKAEDLELFIKILKELNQETKSWGGNFIVTTIPSQNRYKNFTSYLDELYYDKKIFKELQLNNIKFINVDDVFKKTSNPEQYYDGHLNYRGNQVLSNLLINHVLDN